MLLSADRQTYFIHLIVNSLEKKKDVVSYEDKEKALWAVRQAMSKCMKECTAMDQAVRDKITSLKRNVQEASSEWEVLYSNYMEAEAVKRGVVSTKSANSR